ncbi:glycosyltransferase family 4 protein [Tabrizicola oligotrophica]|uniref:Glycosyltransferase family 4 protein n=1 Tax=Tabrizicola oligotrophica TaxID=2710650 RepID=A0A6M0QV57_9RHOB|nr:glycosyltransferase family 4 protein [Tabrizicola oligotrophica]NEY91315.1 glycosyltransferase family 4 protein [Tabrizicola oligotrophica]
MTRPENAAIWYAQDGFDPAAKGINGRRVAGESFLRGYLRHAEVEEFVLLTKFPEEVEPVRALAERLRPGVPVRAAGLMRPPSIAPVETVFYPSPNYATEAWRRAPYGTGAFALSGITHTTSTAAVMEGWMNLRIAPVEEWDAVICTSKAVQASVSFQLDLIDAHLKRQLNAQMRPRPMLPVIPLGIHCDDFVPDPAAGHALRERLGAKEGDVVFTTIARLTPHEKFDPLPIYLAMQAAQRKMPAGQKLHIAFCGVFREDYSRKVFTEGARRLMPDVGFALLDGAKAEERRQVLSGADVFMFLIDNIQETFGLAPIEAMAAGLPLLVSDWDGMKDTVTPDVGFRVTSRMLPGPHLAQEALRYQGGFDTYVQYCSLTSALTEIDMGELTARILDLALNPGLRRKMGAAGQARARTGYDWAQIVPMMQALWGEQAARRRAAGKAVRYGADALPMSPSPTALFASYPTEKAGFAGLRLVARDLTGRLGPEEVLDLRDYAGVKRIFAQKAQVLAVLQAIEAAGLQGAEVGGLATGLNLPVHIIERIAMWLLKYDFIRRA